MGIGKNECPFCGINTSLLSDREKVTIENVTYCKSCKIEGVSKKNVTPGDFGKIFNSITSTSDPIVNVRKEAICNNLPGIQIAHLCGERYGPDCMYLDLYYDKDNNKVYYRLCLSDDDDDWCWGGTETYCYPTLQQAVELLHKNDIHILDGMTDEKLEQLFK